MTQTTILFKKLLRNYRLKRSSQQKELAKDFNSVLKKFLNKKSFIEWISNNCKQLVCLHFDNPMSYSKSLQIEFKEIGKLLSDKIEIEMNFWYFMRSDSTRALTQNMPQRHWF